MDWSSPQVGIPAAELVGCTTAGDRRGRRRTARWLSSPCVSAARARAACGDRSGRHGGFTGGWPASGIGLAAPGLRHVLVLGQGVQINGSALDRRDLRTSGDRRAAVRAGWLAMAVPSSGPGPCRIRVVAAADRRDRLSGEELRVGNGSFHGWRPFGPVRKVTRSAGNVLFELDGQPRWTSTNGTSASTPKACRLRACFPFEMLGEDRGALGLIWTILGVDESAGSLVLGRQHRRRWLPAAHARLDRLAGRWCDGGGRGGARRGSGCRPGESLVLLVSCVGRKLVGGARADEEVEAVQTVFGPKASIAGFTQRRDQPDARPAHLPPAQPDHDGHAHRRGVGS